MATPGVGIRASLCGIAVLALGVPVAVVLHPPAMPARHAKSRLATLPQIVPETVVPDVEPVEVRDLTPEDARAYNASIPFVTGPNPEARPFRFAGAMGDLGRATDCLAAAAYYEAGDDAIGERAVVQVVLNRLRHPAFPKTVCGVVFQGSERATGCQFTFTCDGAMARTPSDAAWRRAREIASAALSGRVFGKIGYATHYHTDWVVPYWQASLDKLAEVHTHLFFRWTGWWGTPAAFNRSPRSEEPVIAALARLSPDHARGAVVAQAADALADAAPYIGPQPMPLANEADTFAISLPATRATEFAGFARTACGERSHCKIFIWTDSRMKAAAMPLSPEQLQAMSFSYLRDRDAGLERMLWNCAEFRAAPGPCMKREALRLSPAPLLSPALAPPAMRTTTGPPELEGVRRKPATESRPAVTSTPAA